MGEDFIRTKRIVITINALLTYLYPNSKNMTFACIEPKKTLEGQSKRKRCERNPKPLKEKLVQS
jgi:hypothetical protein